MIWFSSRLFGDVLMLYGLLEVWIIVSGPLMDGRWLCFSISGTQGLIVNIFIAAVSFRDNGRTIYVQGRSLIQRKKY